MPRALTYAQAQDHLLNVLQLQGWDVARTDACGKKLKVPHATRGRSRVYFKSQSLHLNCGPPFSVGAARSTHDDPRELAELVGDDSIMRENMSLALEGRCLRGRLDNPCECDDATWLQDREDNPTGYPLTAKERAGKVMYRPKLAGKKQRPRVYLEADEAADLKQGFESLVSARQQKVTGGTKPAAGGKRKAPPRPARASNPGPSPAELVRKLRF